MWNSACRWASPRLALLAGGELTGEDRRRAERHLIVCGDCRTRLGSLRESLGALQIAATSTVPAPDAPSLWPALARQMREARHPEPVSFAFRPMWIGLAASALVIGLAAWSLGGRGGSNLRTIASNQPLHPESPAPMPSPAIAESNPNTTIAENAPSHRPEGETVANAPSSSAPRRGEGPREGRIAAEPTH